MFPDGHIYIYRAEQAARARAHLRYADRPVHPRRTLSDLIRNLSNRHRSAGATSKSHTRGGRLAWRRN